MPRGPATRTTAPPRWNSGSACRAPAWSGAAVTPSAGGGGLVGEGLVQLAAGGGALPRPLDDLLGRAQVGRHDHRVVDDLVGRSSHHDLTEYEGDHLVGHRGDERHVVLDDDEAGASLVADVEQQWS